MKSSIKDHAVSVGLGSVVDIATRLRTGLSPGSNLRKGNKSLPLSPSFNWYRVSFPGVKWPGLDVDRSP